MPYEYFSDEEHLKEWLTVEKDPEAFRKFLQENIYGCEDHEAYLRRNGGIKRIIELRSQEMMLYAKEK